MLAATDEHRATQRDKGPERRDLGVVSRTTRSWKARHRGQHRCRFGVGVVEHGDQTDDELGDPPAVREVAEVDDAGDDRPTVGAAVATRLSSVRSPWIACSGSCWRRSRRVPRRRPWPARHARAGPGPHAPRQQLGHHLRGPAAGPTAASARGRVGDAAQLRADPSGGVPELADDRRGEVVPPRQRPALDVGEQADGVLRAVDAHRGGLGDRDRHREAGQAPRQQPQDVVLRGQRGRRPAGVRHLQHEAPAVVLEPEVAVLLAAELGQAEAVDAVRPCEQAAGVVGVEPGTRQFSAAMGHPPIIGDRGRRTGHGWGEAPPPARVRSSTTAPRSRPAAATACGEQSRSRSCPGRR